MDFWARLRARGALVLALGLLAVSSLSLWAVEAPERFAGTVAVVDGDTLDVGGTRVRLHAIDAPEMDQSCVTQAGRDWACGVWVTRVVQDRYAGAKAQCTRVDTDRYGRTVARCTVRGEDIAGWLVGEGLAFAYVKYGRDYEVLEQRAMRARRGLHRVSLARPSDHRAGRGGIAPEGCAVKGNVSASGERIYHVPGQAFYDRTRISARRGERWFCSEAAAVAAGWRAARR
ncbi:thermonuclease family protein [Sulfitobacter albidus]|uniref:thermonuclease family protein n=1 Tax=Sulfitobacter albidus TaxID=2829501 RepID=UPI0020C837D7|nr:thermonuclease family protein [Sulfitobacter albidus]